MEMKKIEKAIKGLFVAGALVAAGGTFAATQGTLGGTSTGTIDIDVSVGDQIQITALADMIGTHVPTVDFVRNSPACVYTNNPTGNYDVTMTSANPDAGNNFRLSDGTTFVIYNVTYDDGTGGPVSMTSSVTNNTFDNADTSTPDCSSVGGPQSRIDINVPAANLDVVGAGTYSDVVTILVAPR